MAAERFPRNFTATQLSDNLTYTCIYFPTPRHSKKPTILFLHNFPSSPYDWHHQITYFASQGHGVIAPDLLGYGDTSSPEKLEPYKFKNMSNDIGKVLKHCDVDIDLGEKVHIVGHDFGSPFLSTLVAYHPNMALICTFVAVT